MAKKKHYATLGVSEDASTETIRNAHRRRARDTHPDRNPGDDQAKTAFEDVQAAFKCLTDDNARQRYDETGEDGAIPKAGFADLIAKVAVLILTEAVNQGVDLDTNDLIAMITTKMRDFLKENVDGKNNLEKIVAKLRAAKSRVTEPDSIMGIVLGAEIAKVGEQVRKVAAQIPPIEEAVAYLKKCKYKCDKRKEEFRNMLNGTGATMTFFTTG